MHLDFSKTETYYAICEDWLVVPRQFISLEKARELFKSGKIKSGSSDFYLLAEQFNFDIDAYWNYYEVPTVKRIFKDK